MRYKTFILRRANHQHTLTTKLSYSQIVNRLIGTGIIVTQVRNP
jgi:hypothetical protein